MVRARVASSYSRDRETLDSKSNSQRPLWSIDLFRVSLVSHLGFLPRCRVSTGLIACFSALSLSHCRLAPVRIGASAAGFAAFWFWFHQNRPPGFCCQSFLSTARAQVPPVEPSPNRFSLLLEALQVAPCACSFSSQSASCSNAHATSPARRWGPKRRGMLLMHGTRPAVFLYCFGDRAYRRRASGAPPPQRRTVGRKGPRR